MPFTIFNQTHDILLFRFGKDARDDRIVSVPPFSQTVLFHKRTSIVLVKRPHHGTSKELCDFVDHADWAAIKLSVAPGRQWQRVSVRGDLPCTIYRNRISRKNHALVVFPSRDASCFLASMPDSAPLSSLMLPGTHETMSVYGWPISQCQRKPLNDQLHAGIRVIDVRLSIIDGRLISHHGIFPEVTPFADILVTLHNFLTSPTTASETVVVSIKQEDSDTQLFPSLVYNEIAASPGGKQMWFLENRIPKLGEVRGKAVMFSRFGSETGNGIHPPIWPDSDKNGFQWECDGTLVRTEDWYNINSFANIPEKATLATELLIPPADSPTPILSIAFSSASSFPLALPPVVALGFGWPNLGLGFKGVNELVGEWLLDQLGSGNTNWRRDSPNDEHQKGLASCADGGAQVRGWLLLDFYEEPASEDVVPLLIECNFRGNRGGEHGYRPSHGQLSETVIADPLRRIYDFGSGALKRGQPCVCGDCDIDPVV